MIARCCDENIIFMALSTDTRPRFTTIADFVSSMENEVLGLFRDVLVICDELANRHQTCQEKSVQGDSHN